MSCTTAPSTATPLPACCPAAPPQAQALGGGAQPAPPASPTTQQQVAVGPTADPLAGQQALTSQPVGTAPTTIGGGEQAATGAALANSEEIVAILEKLVKVVNELIAVLQAQRGTSAGGAAGAPPAQVGGGSGAGAAPTSPAAPPTAATPPAEVAQTPLERAKAVHMTQITSRFTKDAPRSSGTCAIVATVMALRHAGLDVPDANGSKGYGVVRNAYTIATGKESDDGKGTVIGQVEKLVRESGGRPERIGFDRMLEEVRQGVPVILSGNAHDVWHKTMPDKFSSFDGAHSVSVTGYDAASGKYVMSDPLGHAGPQLVSADELRAYAGALGNDSIALAVRKG